MSKGAVLAGEAGERMAETFLRQAGFTILARRFRCARGEVDLVASSAGLLIFVEVKLRAPSSFGSPLEAVHSGKQRRISRAAEAFLAAHPDLSDRDCRFDVIAITRTGDGPGAIQHIPDAFRPGG